MKLFPPILLALGLLVGCQSSPQSQPQIPLAPVYQAGSPVTFNITVHGEDAKVAGGRNDAKGDVGASGAQDQDPVQDVKPSVTVPAEILKPAPMELSVPPAVVPPLGSPDNPIP